MIKVEICAAAAAVFYVNVLVANVTLAIHSAVRRLFVPEETSPVVGQPVKIDLGSVVDQLCGDPASDLAVLAQVRRLAFGARLHGDGGRSKSVADRNRDEAIAVEMICDQVMTPGAENLQRLKVFRDIFGK